MRSLSMVAFLLMPTLVWASTENDIGISKISPEERVRVEVTEIAKLLDSKNISYENLSLTPGSTPSKDVAAFTMKQHGAYVSFRCWINLGKEEKAMSISGCDKDLVEGPVRLQGNYVLENKVEPNTKEKQALAFAEILKNKKVHFEDLKTSAWFLGRYYATFKVVQNGVSIDYNCQARLRKGGTQLYISSCDQDLGESSLMNIEGTFKL